MGMMRAHVFADFGGVYIDMDDFGLFKQHIGVAHRAVAYARTN